MMNGNNNKTLRTMKNKIISIIQALVLLWGVTSCHSPEELGSDIQREGINSITASFPNDDSSENSFKGEIDYTNHSITFIFPYNYPKLSDNVLPTSALKRVRLSASLANNVSMQRRRFTQIGSKRIYLFYLRCLK